MPTVTNRGGTEGAVARHDDERVVDDEGVVVVGVEKQGGKLAPEQKARSCNKLKLNAAAMQKILNNVTYVTLCHGCHASHRYCLIIAQGPRVDIFRHPLLPPIHRSFIIHNGSRHFLPRIMSYLSWSSTTLKYPINRSTISSY